MNKEIIDMLENLSQCDAPSGFETEARIQMQKYLQPHVEELYLDNLGSVISKIGQTGPKVAILGHLDEIGFVVTKIDDKGFIRFKTLGGWWGHVMLSQAVTITTRAGKKIRGVIGSKPPHVLKVEERTKVMEHKDMYIDVGVSSKAELVKLGVAKGDMVTPYFPFQHMGNEKYLLAKAWDNRVGCAVVAQVMKELQNITHENTVYGVGTVQEEVGLRGAQTATYTISPDICFAVDVSLAGDMPNIDKNELSGELGQGPQILIIDGGMIGHQSLRNFVCDVAKECNIPIQIEYLNGGSTDAAAAHKTHSGIPSLVIGVSTRYIHSHTSIIHYDDVVMAVNLLLEVIKRLDDSTVKKITEWKY